MLENSVVKHNRAKRASQQDCDRQAAKKTWINKWSITCKQVEST